MIALTDALRMLAYVRNNAVSHVRLRANVEDHPAQNHVVDNHTDVQWKGRKEVALVLLVRLLLGLDGRHDLDSVPQGLL